MSIRITANTDSVDISHKSLGLDATRDTFPADIRDHIQRDRGLHIQIRHNQDPQTFAQARHLADLIAAAPDLLEALKLCLHDDAGNLEPATVHKAMEAIAKAERRS